MNTKYKKTWLMFINIKAGKNLKLIDLIDVDNNSTKSDYIGAWANIIVKANDINQALKIVPLGLRELGFEIEFIDKVENIMSLIEYDEIDKNVIEEVDWLLSSEYVFKISDKIFPYESNQLDL